MLLPFAISKTTVLFLKQERDTSSKKRLRMPASSSFLKMAVVSACVCHGVPKGRRIGEVAPGRQGKARPLADNHSIAAAVRGIKINREDFGEQQEAFGSNGDRADWFMQLMPSLAEVRCCPCLQ